MELERMLREGNTCHKRVGSQPATPHRWGDPNDALWSPPASGNKRWHVPHWVM